MGLILCFSCQKKNEPEKFLSIVEFNKLDEMAKFLMTVGDENPGVTNNCGIKPAEARQLLVLLHPLIDAEIKSLKDQKLQISSGTCKTGCHCSGYSDLYSDEKIKQLYIDEFMKQSAEEKLSCVNSSAKWLCDSDLLKKLKSQPIENAKGL